jgi:hypothetical protein
MMPRPALASLRLLESVAPGLLRGDRQIPIFALDRRSRPGDLTLRRRMVLRWESLLAITTIR